MRSSFLVVFFALASTFAPAAESLLAPAPAPAPVPPRKVEVGFHLVNLPEIDEPAETFVVISYLSLSWREPDAVFEGTEPKVWFEEEAEEKVRDMWHPNVQFCNQAEPSETLHTVLTNKPDGTVIYGREIEVRLKSELDLHRFPFDRQTLQMQIESFGYSTKSLMFELAPARLVGAKKLSLDQWQLEGMSWTAAIDHDVLTADDYHGLAVSFDVRRKPGYYVWQIFVPLFLLILISGAVFFLPAGDLADRMNIVVTALLTAVALSYAVHTDLPKIAYLTVVDRLFVVAYIFLGAKIAGMLVVEQRRLRHEERALALDRRLRWFFPAVYGVVNILIVAPALLSG